MAFRSTCQKIKKADWHQIKSQWLNFLPNIEHAGSPPPLSLSEIIQQSGKLATITPQSPILQGIPMIHETALWEAVYLLRKSGHVMRVSQNLSQQGMLSWSLFNGYHSAYLSAKSILAMLGFSVPQPSGQQLLLELFPDNRNQGNKKNKIPVGGDEMSNAYRIGRLDQNQLWQLFERALRMIDVPIWNGNILENVKDFDWANISKKRNPFLYNSVFWPYNDLSENLIDDKFCNPPDNFPDHTQFIDMDDPEFLIKSAFLLFHLGECLLADISIDAPIMKLELDTFDTDEWRNDNTQYFGFFSP